MKNKIHNISNLVKKTGFNTKINEIENKITDHDHDKYITTPEFNKLTAENFAARLAQANLASKSDIANFVKKTDFDDKLKNLNKKVTSNKTKHLLVENEFKKLQTFDSSLFIGQSYFNNDGAQLYLIFQPIYKTISIFSGLPTKSQNGNLRDCQMKNFSLLLQQVKVFLQNWYGIIIKQNYNLKESS